MAISTAAHQGTGNGDLNLSIEVKAQGAIVFDTPLDPTTKLSEEVESQVGDQAQFGMRGNEFVDSMARVFSVNPDIFSERYICTFAVSIGKGRSHDQPLSGPNDVTGYLLQICVGDHYEEVLLRPTRRSQAEEIHKMAIDGTDENTNAAGLKSRVIEFAKSLSVEIIDISRFGRYAQHGKYDAERQ